MVICLQNPKSLKPIISIRNYVRIWRGWTHFPRLRLFNLNYQKLDLVTLPGKNHPFDHHEKNPWLEPPSPFPLPAPRPLEENICEC